MSLRASLLGFAVGLLSGLGCATSDQVLDAEQQLAQIESQPRKSAECRPGTVAPCYSGASETATRGACRQGKHTCDEQGFWLKCEGEVVPQPELCNRLDDDCDGVVDNGFERDGAICFRGEGACKSRGAWHCAADGKSSVCDAQVVQPSTEICDGVDNDCDKQIDEGDVPGAGQACVTGLAGVCNPGVKRCVGGTIRCLQNVQPSVEVCNKLDDNCNNDVDEDCISEKEAQKIKSATP